MAKRIQVLIVVDAAAALASGDLQNNVYLVDTNKYHGSTDEGKAELITACQDRQVIGWRVESISPDNEVSIKGFIGKMIDEKICIPEQNGLRDGYWEGEIEARMQHGDAMINTQYSTILVIDGKSMNFDPFLHIYYQLVVGQKV